MPRALLQRANYDLLLGASKEFELALLDRNSIREHLFQRESDQGRAEDAKQRGRIMSRERFQYILTGATCGLVLLSLVGCGGRERDQSETNRHNNAGVSLEGPASADSAAHDSSSDPEQRSSMHDDHGAEPKESMLKDERKFGTISVKVKVSGGDAGQVVLLLKKETFGFDHTNAVETQSGSINDGVAQLEFPNVPHGSYAIAAFHDKNTNGKVDRAFGRTMEKLGASKNPPIVRGRLLNMGPSGPKPWFKLESRSLSLEINL